MEIVALGENRFKCLTACYRHRIEWLEWAFKSDGFGV